MGRRPAGLARRLQVPSHHPSSSLFAKSSQLHIIRTDPQVNVGEENGIVDRETLYVHTSLDRPNRAASAEADRRHNARASESRNPRCHVAAAVRGLPSSAFIAARSYRLAPLLLRNQHCPLSRWPGIALPPSYAMAWFEKCTPCRAAPSLRRRSLRRAAFRRRALSILTERNGCWD